MKTTRTLRYLSLSGLLFVSLIAISCGDEPGEGQSEDRVEETGSTTYTALNPLLKVDPEVEEQLRDWKAYWDLQQEMEVFRAKSVGDLTYITDELLRIQGELIHDSIPEKVQIPAVKSRSLVFGTFARKLKDQLTQRAPSAEVDTTRMKLMESYNAFRFHITDALREKVFEDFLQQDSTFLDTIRPRE